MNDRIFLKCGCVATSWRVMPDGSRVPSCILHDCIEVASVPDLAGRTARCVFNNARPLAKPWRNSGPIYGGGDKAGLCDNKTGGGCRCIVPSSLELPFFEHRPDDPHDKFFCGCAGWD